MSDLKAREIARMREVARDWRRPSMAQIEGPNDLKIYGGTIADDIDRWAARLAALEEKLRAAARSLKAVSDDLHAELLARYGDDHVHYPSMRRKFEADMAVVNEARTTLQSIGDENE